ncbi:MAG: aldehyde dehydrogenase family protein [Planctomycetia bacterium]
MKTPPPILIAGTWRPATAADSFRAFDPSTGRPHDTAWPVSGWADVDAALDAAVVAARELAALPDGQRADFLERYAARLERQADALVAAAHAETGLAVKPRLTDVELPRMLDQLRQAAHAAREGTWRMAMLDTQRNIRSAAFGLGPVVVFPPGNFPFAYGAVTGGDFAAAIAAGNPVIAKAHPGCPTVSLIAAREAAAALAEAGLPPATIQLLHGIAPADGERLVADPRVGVTGFTGGHEAGRKLFAAASSAGRVIWVEMGSLNPVVLLPGALAERGPAIAGELTASVTGSAGQFCTKPGLVFLIDDAAGRVFVAALVEKFSAVGQQVLLGPLGLARLSDGVARLRTAGARLVAGEAPPAEGCRHPATLLEVSAADVLARPDRLFVEAFGNATLVVRAATLAELAQALALVPGALGASLYLAQDGCDDDAATAIQPLLEARTGRIIENRMPTGLAVTPPMQHGGPWPSAAPPFFSAVGMPWSILRFARRLCFDGVSAARLPECLRDAPPQGRPWRYVDHEWTRCRP